MSSVHLLAGALVALTAACAGHSAPAAAPAAGGRHSPGDAPAGAPAAVERPWNAAGSVSMPNAYRTALANGTRGGTGAPGEAYWQQRVSYRIEAELDPGTALLRGTERIVYHNRSPHALEEVALNLYQNVFAEGVPRNRYSPITGGMTLDRVVADGTVLAPTTGPNDPSPGVAVRGTIGWIVLPSPVAAGDSVVLEIDWHFVVPPEGTYRTGWEDELGGRAFVVAQWYPQIATYDDLRGWDATPYLGDGEFYLEYGDFEVALTLPAGWLVGASGELRNAEAVLTEPVLARLEAALAGEGTTTVATADALAAGEVTRGGLGGSVTWRFRAEDVRDFAFAASDRYRWDVTAAEVAADGGSRDVAIHALYRPGEPNWERAAEFGRHAIEFLSKEIAPYPYPQVTIAEGTVGGMEYPQVMFIGNPRDPEGLYGVIAHEAVHFWFPMLVGSDEARHAWMDEGMASYFGALASADFFGGDDPHAGNRRSYLAVAGSDAEVPLMRHTDLVTPYGARGVAAYTKPATLYRALRTVLGDERFDSAVRQYVRDWSYRHPAPWDFFSAMERAAGRNLSWFFGPWWFGTGTLDQAIHGVEATGGRVRITIARLGEIAMPVRLVATTAAGAEVRREIPVEAWSGTRTVTVVLDVPGPVARVEIDPDAAFPDTDRANNVWTAEGARTRQSVDPGALGTRR